MPRLDVRLRAVAELIRAVTHVDVGSDHGGLLVNLLRTERVRRGIAIENKRQPYKNSHAALAGLNADVRFGDGLEVLAAGEADSLSICGMGGQSIARILSEFPDRLPDFIVLQPNRRPELVRQWGLEGSFHLVDEQIARGHWPYTILSYKRADASPDVAYDDVDREAALLFGPLILKRFDDDFAAQLQEEQAYLRGFEQLADESRKRLLVIERILRDSGS